MYGVCWEGSQCLFLYDLVNSKLFIICKYYQKGYCVYGIWCRYDYMRFFVVVGGVVGIMVYSVFFLVFYSFYFFFEVIVFIVKINLYEFGKCEKRMLVFRD